LIILSTMDSLTSTIMGQVVSRVIARSMEYQTGGGNMDLNNLTRNQDQKTCGQLDSGEIIRQTQNENNVHFWKVTHVHFWKVIGIL